MKIVLHHNCILRAKMTETFASCMREQLPTLVSARFDAGVDAVLMYEDYLADRFVADGRAFYPLTVSFGGVCSTVWISWSTEGLAADNPYATAEGDTLSLSWEEQVPPAFVDALRGRRIAPDDGAMYVEVEAQGLPAEALIGTYSQSFLDEMASRLTRLIEQKEGISSLAEAGFSLKLPFAPATFMEHTDEARTYRRLLLTDGGRTVRDLWVFWERTDGAGAYSVADLPTEGTVRFALGEDVSQTVRQREYRYLLKNEHNNTEAYTRAMGRRNVTEWRDLIKKAIKRGVLTLTGATPSSESERASEEASALAHRLSDMMETAPAATECAPAVEDDALTAALRDALMAVRAAERPTALELPLAQTAAPEQAPLNEPEEQEDAVPWEEPVIEEPVIEEPVIEEPVIEEPVIEEPVIEEPVIEEPVIEEPVIEEPVIEEPVMEQSEEEKELAERRRLLEAERRLTEQTARAHAERIARLTEEQQERAAEIRRLAEERERREAEATLEVERQLAEERERLRRYEEELMAREAAMRERITEDVRRAFAEREARRMEEEARLALETEARKRAKEQELEAERARLEEARLTMEAKRAEAEILAAEMRRAEEARLAEQARQAELVRQAEERRAAEASRLAEEQERLEAARREEARLQEMKTQAEEELRLVNERHAAELSRLEAERIRIAEQARQLEEARAREEEEHRRRIAEREMALRDAVATRAAEEERRLNAAAEVAEREARRLRSMEDEARMRERAEDDVRAAAARRLTDVVTDDEPTTPTYTFGAYKLCLHFDRAVDPNIHTGIRALVEKTVRYFKKESVPMAMRSTVAEGNRVNLHVYRMPKEEYDLLIHIVKVLGNSDLGIRRITLDEEA